MELATRQVCIAGITKHPDTQWMLQMARQLTDTADGILLSTRYLILDRDTKYCTFRVFVKRAGIEAIRLPPQSPNLNAYAERFVLTARTEVTDQMLIFGDRHLRLVLAEYEAHYNGRRPHRSPE